MTGKEESTIAQSSSQAGPALSSERAPEQRGVPGLLRLLGAGATGPILMALQAGPLRSKELATQVPGFASRTVYRYLGRLSDLKVLAREGEAGVPSRVIYRLTEPCGVELAGVVHDYAKTNLIVLPNGDVVPHSWSTLALLGDLWESGMFQALATDSCTATELARLDHGLSFHQISRRMTLLLIDGLVQEERGGQKRRRYGLTEKALCSTALIAGLGVWREKHPDVIGEPGLTAAEAACLDRVHAVLHRRVVAQVDKGEPAGYSRSPIATGHQEPYVIPMSWN